jgi:hypothetical protein
MHSLFKILNSYLPVFKFYFVSFNFNQLKSKIKRFSQGFLITEEKSVFTPVTQLEWLGNLGNSGDYCLSIPKRKVDVVII